MEDRKDAFYGQLARMGKAVAAPRRLELVDLLAQAPRTVDTLAQLSGMSIANTSQHLQVLRAAGLVEASKDGLFVTYRLASDSVAGFFLRLRNLAEERLVELEGVKQRFFGSLEDVDIISGKQLLARLRRGQVIVLDVRPLAEYAAGHLKGALSMPHDEVKRRFQELPKNRRVVAYCRGPYCVYAAEAVRVLRARGLDAVRIEDGVPEWRALGLPIETLVAGARA
jgi:rhodanese-related sulfurtransferase